MDSQRPLLRPADPAGVVEPRWLREEPLAGDASSRRYTRLFDGAGLSAIRAQYPPDSREVLTRDLEVLRWLHQRGLRVPALLSSDLAAGWVLLEDVGEKDAAEVLGLTPAERRGDLALSFIAPLRTLANLDPDQLPPWNLPLDRHRMRWELAGFEQWFVCYACASQPGPELDRWLGALASEVASHPARVCHRDYHLNNLFPGPGTEVAVIDVQDLMVGPDTYDAISLIGERALPELLSPQQRRQWLQEWARQTSAAPGWEERWPKALLQRGLKVLGTFARLTISGRPGYRQWMPSLARSLAANPLLPGELRQLLLHCPLCETARQFGGEDDR